MWCWHSTKQSDFDARCKLEGMRFRGSHNAGIAVAHRRRLQNLRSSNVPQEGDPAHLLPPALFPCSSSSVAVNPRTSILTNTTSQNSSTYSDHFSNLRLQTPRPGLEKISLLMCSTLRDSSLFPLRPPKAEGHLKSGPSTS